MTRQLISTSRQPLLRHLTRSVRRAVGFVQVGLWEVISATSCHRTRLASILDGLPIWTPTLDPSWTNRFSFVPV